jgi:hypothetical protein
MGGLPAGKYAVMVDPDGTFYKPGEKLVTYPGQQGSLKQDWTLYTDQQAIPSAE